MLPDVICSHCNFSRDLDLCRDPEFVHPEAMVESPDGDGKLVAALGNSAAWRCAECAQPYNKPAIEAELVSWLQRYALGVSLTDLVRRTAATHPRCRACSLQQQQHKMRG